MRSTMDPAARLRGASVGAASGAVSVAAHALGGGAVPVDSAAVPLLVAACALTGVLVASVGTGLARLMVLLGAGQAVGHAALSVAPEHCHRPGFAPAMLVAHLVAIPVGALLIRGAEVALGRVLSRVRRLVVALGAVPAVAAAVWRVVEGVRVVSARRLLWSSGVGRRGPPRGAGVVALYNPLAGGVWGGTVLYNERFGAV
ncbi:hypothetical protein [Nocardia wallacei]|uniref:hypothetical protein n=1 Tax=Nocardia wallacei TaxID=480035 RepID=UPI002454E673|nr:hypothetical protein [Nocardia wallacei]